MTPAQLRQRAAATTTKGLALDRDAGRLRGHAAELDGMLDQLVPVSQRAWVGPAADDFERQARAHAAVINGFAQRLRAAATEMGHEARDAHNAAARLRAEAAALESAGVGVA